MLKLEDRSKPPECSRLDYWWDRKHWHQPCLVIQACARILSSHQKII